MRFTLAVMVALAGPLPTGAEADSWKRLEGSEITAALAARVLGYPDGTLQDFFADGRTLYADSIGHWDVRDGRYCSLWPPSDRWTCYGVDRNGLDIRFTAEDGTMTVGRYVDLR